MFDFDKHFPPDGGGSHNHDKHVTMAKFSFARNLQRQATSVLDKRESRPHAAPFIVSIQLMTLDNELLHICAGTIIDKHWILTAAHCLMSGDVVENAVIVAGCHDLQEATGPNDEHCVQLRRIDHYVRHELYLGGTNPYDIALIYVETPFEFNEFVQAAELPAADEQPMGEGVLYGWGNLSMSYTPKYPNLLHEAVLPILDLALCEKLLGIELHETNLCTGPLAGRLSICSADSGGPLMQNDAVIGIVSWGRQPCGQKNSPSVFVRVSAFTNWIEQIMRKQ